MHLSAEGMAELHDCLWSGHNSWNHFFECDQKTSMASITGVYQCKTLLTKMKPF